MGSSVSTILKRRLKASLVGGWRTESIWPFGVTGVRGVPRKGWPRDMLASALPRGLFSLLPLFCECCRSQGSHHGKQSGNESNRRETETRGSWYPWISSSAQTPGSSLKDYFFFLQNLQRVGNTWSLPSPQRPGHFSHLSPTPLLEYSSQHRWPLPYPFGQSDLHPAPSYGGGGEIRMTVSDLLLIYDSPCQALSQNFWTARHFQNWIFLFDWFMSHSSD